MLQKKWMREMVWSTVDDITFIYYVFVLLALLCLMPECFISTGWSSKGSFVLRILLVHGMGLVIMWQRSKLACD